PHAFNRNLPKKPLFKSTTNPLFTTKISNKSVDSTKVTSLLSGLNSKFIAAGNSTNQAAFNQVIDSNGAKGTFLDLLEPKSNENLQLLVEQIADYIIAEMSEEKVELIFGVGNTMHTNQALISQKVKELVLPKLKDEGIYTTGVIVD